MGNKTKKNDFEKSINRLEELVDKMELGESSLEQNLEWFEEVKIKPRILNDLAKTIWNMGKYR